MMSATDRYLADFGPRGGTVRYAALFLRPVDKRLSR